MNVNKPFHCERCIRYKNTLIRHLYIKRYLYVSRRGTRRDPFKRAKQNTKLINCLDGRTAFKKAFVYRAFNSIHVSSIEQQENEPNFNLLTILC